MSIIFSKCYYVVRTWIRSRLFDSNYLINELLGISFGLVTVGKNYWKTKGFIDPRGFGNLCLTVKHYSVSWSWSKYVCSIFASTPNKCGFFNTEASISSSFCPIHSHLIRDKLQSWEIYISLHFNSFKINCQRAGRDTMPPMAFCLDLIGSIVYSLPRRINEFLKFDHKINLSKFS